MKWLYLILDWMILILTFVFKPVLLWSIVGCMFMSEITKQKSFNDLDQDITLVYIPTAKPDTLDTKTLLRNYQHTWPFGEHYYPVNLKRNKHTTFFQNLDLSGWYMTKYKGVYYIYYSEGNNKLSLSLKDGNKYIDDIQAAKKYYPRFLILEMLVVIALAFYGYWRKVTLKGNKLYFISLGIWAFLLISNSLHVFFLFRYL